ncbi:hypothetical protein ACFFX1_06810 [Dactylosporangium sucinum]|uniref:Membrane-associated oxidoreductase n=1 Tax=Dactylosporangium sucinum TaxID=1424081 RepID=A0A917UBH2_9ACTN|nr:hypothetical protein [Dactylosporangium sucinum]GGM76568.1 hypothetical protein GCM10007977_092570 [Dactylosporangium sucinum]
MEATEVDVAVPSISAVERIAEAFPVGARVDAGGAEVPAAFLVELLTGEPPGRRAALRLRRARVTGLLDLSFAEVGCPLLVEDSEFEQRLDLYWARLGFTSLRGSTYPGLVGAGLAVTGHLRLTHSTCDGALNLKGAKISGGLLLDGAELRKTGGTALSAERIEVGGDLVAEQGFRSDGTLRLFQATIGGGVHLDGAVVHGGTEHGPQPRSVDLDSAALRGGFFARRADVHGEISLRHATLGGVATFTGATLRNPGGVALRCDRADVQGGVHLLGGARAEGEVRLLGTRIGRILRMTDATLEHPGGAALQADNCAVDGPLDCRRITVRGEVSFVEARVAGPAFFDGATLDNPGGRSLRATGIVTASLLNCCNGFTATGRVSVTAAKVGGRLCFDDATLAALRCTGTEAAELSLRFAVPPTGEVDLRHVRTAVVRDDPGTWPAGLRLDGLTYQALEPTLPPGPRLGWLARVVDEVPPPQPYEQLAAVYRQLGHDDEARTVLLAKQRRQRRSRPWWTWPWSWLQDVTVGYGYRPQRAALWLAALLALGASVYAAHPPRPVDPGQAPAFNAIFYTLDLLLPIIDFGQESAYRASGAGQWLAYLLIAAGWTLATTAAAGFTRVLNRS